MRRWMTGALAAAFLLGNAAPLCAADIKLETNNGKARITLRGKILRGDAEKFSALLKSARDNGISVSFLELNSQGGALLDGLKMSDIVRQAKMTTSVPELGMCASACFLIFAGGNEKIMHPVSHLGVHGASDAKGQETIISGSATIMMARKFKELGVPPAVIGKMVVTPPEKTVWLTSSDLSEMGVKVVRGLSSSPTLPTTTMTTVPSGSKASQSLIAIYGAPQNPQPSQGEASPPAAAAAPTRSTALQTPASSPKNRPHVEAKDAFDRGDYASVERLMRPLAEKGDAGAQVMMGASRERSQPADELEAATWYRRAADQKHPYALYMLGRYYALGKGGLRKDRVAAHAMFTLAVQNGSLLASGALRIIQEQLTPEQIADSMKRADEWQRAMRSESGKAEVGIP